jgi:transposase
VYATNQVADGFSLPQAIEAYRDKYLVERNFGRLKGRPLSLPPSYVQRDDHATGLVRSLSLALRVLTLMECVVRRQLPMQATALAGLLKGPSLSHSLLCGQNFVFIACLLQINFPPDTKRVVPLDPIQPEIIGVGSCHNDPR